MDLLLSCQNLSKSFGSRTLFTDLNFSIFQKDRIGLIGLNGCGKSTLLKILAGFETQDIGNVALKKGCKIGYVPQSCEFPEKTPEQVLFDVLETSQMSELEKQVLVETWLSKLGFKGDEPLAHLLSGGWKKRLGLARELILEPDILMLDEPTNHLDLEGVMWLEKFLQRESTTYLLVSHDRYFLQNVTSKIMEIDRVYPKGLFEIEGPYSFFLTKKQEFIEGQIQTEKSIATKARRELEWLRQGVKARTTKSQSRIDEAHEIFETHKDLKFRNAKTVAKISFEASERETRKLLVAKNIKIQKGDRELFRNLDFTLSPGTRLGLMGPNGSGKTTLLRLLNGDEILDSGTIKKADQLEIVYFDQHRAQLPNDLTLRDALSPKGDYVEFRGQRVHVNGWCKRFLFSPDLLDMKIGCLSGGERARISIAHLMLQRADLLLLDEPTNDLDIPTLEALEESLLDFPGAVVLITHDRFMMDRVCTQILSLGDPDQVNFYQDLHQWQSSQKPKVQKVVQEKREEKKETRSKMSYIEKKEYESIEGKIGDLEKKLKKQTSLLETAEVATDSEKLRKTCAEIALLETQIEQLYLRFDELDRKK